jgi:peptidylprolyl isomerase
MRIIPLLLFFLLQLGAIFSLSLQKRIACLGLAFAFTSPSNAYIAPLADVGVKEFLVKDSREWLRLSLPSGRNINMGSNQANDIDKSIQENLELVRLRLEQVGYTSPTAFVKPLTDATLAETMIGNNIERLISNSLDAGAAKALINNELIPAVGSLKEALKSKDYKSIMEFQEKSASLFYKLRKLQLPPATLPYKIPDEYSSYPQLKGRATVEMIVQKKKGGFRLADGKTIVNPMKFTMELDGFHAPVTCGNIVDLINKKVYDNKEFQKVEQLVIQTGIASSPADRKVPLEIFYRYDTEPTYGITSDDDNRATEALALPFQADGALGMARLNDDADSGTSNFFIFKFNQALNPPGRNTLDGFYSLFGYVTSNEELLEQVTIDDKIVSMKVIDGLENFVVQK